MGTIHKLQKQNPLSEIVLEKFLKSWWVVVQENEDITLEEWLVCTATMIEMLAEVSSSSHEEKKILLKKISKKIRN